MLNCKISELIKNIHVDTVPISTQCMHEICFSSHQSLTKIWNFYKRDLLYFVSMNSCRVFQTKGKLTLAGCEEITAELFSTSAKVFVVFYKKKVFKIQTKKFFFLKKFWWIMTRQFDLLLWSFLSPKVVFKLG